MLVSHPGAPQSDLLPTGHSSWFSSEVSSSLRKALCRDILHLNCGCFIPCTPQASPMIDMLCKFMTPNQVCDRKAALGTLHGTSGVSPRTPALQPDLLLLKTWCKQYGLAHDPSVIMTARSKATLLSMRSMPLTCRRTSCT
jgi:hypothetical protein